MNLNSDVRVVAVVLAPGGICSDPVTYCRSYTDSLMLPSLILFSEMLGISKYAP